MGHITISLVFSLYFSYACSQHSVTIKTGEAKNFATFTIQGDTSKHGLQATIVNFEKRFLDAVNLTMNGIDAREFKSYRPNNDRHH